jgi:hypothetical protein
MLPDCHWRRSRAARKCRRGISLLEFAGCIVAVLGGVWLGAMYLGVNVEHAAHSALEQTQLLDKVPSSIRPEGPQQNAITQEQLVTTLRKELGTLRKDIKALRHETESQGRATIDTTATADAGHANTRAYWLRLSEIARGEDELQRDAETAIDDVNAANVFAIKARVSRFAAKGIEAVPSEDVDDAVVKFGRQLALWYKHGDELYERAVQIWETPGGQQARAKLTEDWKRDELQHRQEAQLLRERAAVLRAAISRQFGEEFPEFAQPVASLPTAEPQLGNGANAD